MRSGRAAAAIGYVGGGRRRVRVLVATGLLTLLATGSAWAFQALPATPLNDDPAAGIDRTQSVSGTNPTNADVAGGALTAGGVAVPWAIFQQGTPAGGHDQIFVRSFAGGSWTTRGSGTVGGRSSALPTLRASLNFDQAQDGEVPSIDFAGSGRTVPWASWSENTTGAGFGGNNVFASRFDNSGDANEGKWIFGGQGRGTGGGTVPVPSINIHTNQSAQNASLAGGSASDPTAPGPWITWQETDAAPIAGVDQIFAERPIGPGAANCDGVTPAGTVDGSGHVPAVGGFCWQDVGIARTGAGSVDPSLNVDPTRNGIEPDIAFSGTNDSVPWVVWYELNTTHVSGLHNNEMVFAAEGVPDASAIGGFEWIAVGSGLQGTLDTSATNGFGTCAASASNEAQCSLNHDPTQNAEDPQVAAGTMTAGSPTVPWVVWDEPVNGVNQVFAARLIGSGSNARFQIANNGAPISSGTGDSTRAAITFSGATPYVTWRQSVNGVATGSVGHFINAAAPTFVLDEADIPLTPTAQADVREPISSSCTANPFNQDGAACQGGSYGTPFFLFTNGTSPLGLFAGAYQPSSILTGGASSITTSSASVGATVNPAGASVAVHFQYGPTTAYGLSTPAQSSGVANSAVPLSAPLAGLAASAVVHYRAVAVTDFGTFVGADQSFTTASGSASPPGPSSALGHARLNHKRVSGTGVGVKVTCPGTSGARCELHLRLSVRETLRGHHLIAVTARRVHLTHRVVGVGSTSITLDAGDTATVRINLNATGRALLRRYHHLTARFTATQTLVASSRRVASATISFTLPRRHTHR